MQAEAKPTKPAKIFLSYSHKDERWKDKLLTHLSPMRRQGSINSWDDRQIKAGSQWNDEILKHFNEADVILCLISPDFIDSDYCYQIEAQRALEKRELGQVEVIPILLREVDWKKTPFHALQVIPRDNKPIASRANKDKALAEVAREIEKVVNSHHSR